jgi:prepilin-type N-terminal cleavage/methylation domain-containing protein
MRSKRSGFTIIEMLAVMVVIGVLATIAYARLQTSKDKAVVASMISDLHAVAQEQEAFYFQNRTYSTTLATLNSNPSQGNVPVVATGNSAGWSGSISNPKVSKQCYIFVGAAAPIGSATRDGVIDCS